MPMKPGIHISNPADFEDDGDDDYAASKSAAERIADIRAETEKARSRREAKARRPKTIGDLDSAAIWNRFNNPPKGKTLEADED